MPVGEIGKMFISIDARLGNVEAGFAKVESGSKRVRGALTQTDQAWKNAAKTASAADRQVAASAVQRVGKVDKALEQEIMKLRANGASWAQIAQKQKQAGASATQTAAAIERASGRQNTAIKQTSGHFATAAKRALAFGAATVGAYALISKGRQAISATEELAHATISLHRNLGLSVKSASEWAAVAKTRNVETKALNMSFGTLSRNVMAATSGIDKQKMKFDALGASQKDQAARQKLLAAGAGAQADAFEKLGVSQDLLKSGDFNAILKATADGLHNLGPGVDRTALSMKLFGRGWQTIVPVLRGGSAEMQRNLDLANKYGASFGGKSLHSVEDMIKAQREAKFATMGLQIAFATQLAPILTDVIKKVAHFVGQMRDGSGAGGRFADKMREVADDVKKVAGPVIDVAKWLAKHPALLAAAGAAWVAYKTAAVAQIAVVKAAELGLFGAGMKAKLASQAGATGGLAGRSFAAKAGLAAAAGVAGWEIGSWLRKHVPVVRSAGDWLGTTLGKAIYGGAKVEVDKLDNSIAETIKRISRQIAGIPALGTIPPAPKKNTPLDKLPGLTKPGGGKKVPKTARVSSAGGPAPIASASGFAGIVASAAAGGSVTGDTGGLNSDFLNRMRAMSAGTGTPISVTSGRRTAAEQQQLVNEKGIWSPSNPTGAAPVGSSLHEKGLAADISPGREHFGGVCGRYGLSFPIGAEPWHCQPSGAATSVPAGGSTGTSTTGTPAAPPKPTTPVYNAPPLSKAFIKRANTMIRTKRIASAKKAHKKRIAGLVNNTLDNPWLQAYMTHQDYLVAKGVITQEQADANKKTVLANAIGSGKLSEADVVTAQGQINDLTPAAPDAGVPLSGLETIDQAQANIDLHVRAGDETAAQGIQDKINLINAQLANTSGWSDQDILQLRAELGDLKSSQDDLTSAVKDNTATQQATIDLLKQQHDEDRRAIAIASSEVKTFGKFVTALVNGEIGGKVGLRSQTGIAGKASVAY